MFWKRLPSLHYHETINIQTIQSKRTYHQSKFIWWARLGRMQRQEKFFWISDWPWSENVSHAVPVGKAYPHLPRCTFSTKREKIACKRSLYPRRDPRWPPVSAITNSRSPPSSKCGKVSPKKWLFRAILYLQIYVCIVCLACVLQKLYMLVYLCIFLNFVPEHNNTVN